MRADCDEMFVAIVNTTGVSIPFSAISGIEFCLFISGLELHRVLMKQFTGYEVDAQPMFSGATSRNDYDPYWHLPSLVSGFSNSATDMGPSIAIHLAYIDAIRSGKWMSTMSVVKQGGLLGEPLESSL